MRRKGQTTNRTTRPTGQLRLLAGDRRESPAEWVLDERTRRLGRAGVAAIRETLRQAQPPEPFSQAS